jgi:hypothetical protein
VAPSEQDQTIVIPEDDLRKVMEVVPADLLQQALDTSKRAINDGTVPDHLQTWLNEGNIDRLQLLVDQQQGRQPEP